MKVEAIFSDYDGTLSPLQAPREKAFIAPELLHLLVRIGKRIPIAVITTKDLAFVKDRVPFAHGIGAIGSLEILVGAKRMVDTRMLNRVELVEEAFDVALSKIDSADEIILERKTTGNGILASFCLDWRLAHDKVKVRMKVKSFLAQCRKMGLFVVESAYTPFADVYAVKVDKGKILLRLMKELGASRPLMYLGDSEIDNPAFRRADVSIAIGHKESSRRLASKYYLRFEDLPRFLSDLLTANFRFRSSTVKRISIICGQSEGSGLIRPDPRINLPPKAS